jgi:hypothetical protein
MDELMRDGLPVAQVASELAATVEGAHVLADAVRFDLKWARDLYGGAGEIAPPFLLEDFALFAFQFCYARNLYPFTAIADANHTAFKRYPKMHRALPDAQRNAHLLRVLAGTT